MALFSYRHTVKTFSLKREKNAREALIGQTAAHLRYITRPSAASVVVRERVCSGKNIEVAKKAEAEAQQKKGRVCERFTIALPVEASATQRQALVRAYGEALTEGLAGYIAAIHDKHDNDTANPHFHMVAFDHYQKSGGRGRPRSTLGMARKHAVERTAKLWADTHNRLMKSWGYGPDSMIDHRSYQSRGIDRIPQIHEGPAARSMAKKGKRPEPKSEWANIDGGHTRAEANKIICEINTLKETVNDKQGTDKLGRGDNGNPHQWQTDRTVERACSGRIIDSNSGTEPARANPCQVGAKSPRNPGEAGKPPFLDSKSPEGGTGNGTEHRKPPFLDWSRFRRRRGIRRIYRELVMLRDTLRARLIGQPRQQVITPPAHEIAVKQRPKKRSLEQER